MVLPCRLGVFDSVTETGSLPKRKHPPNSPKSGASLRSFMKSSFRDTKAVKSYMAMVVGRGYDEKMGKECSPKFWP
jgi:hypothetical protein